MNSQSERASNGSYSSASHAYTLGSHLWTTTLVTGLSEEGFQNPFTGCEVQMTGNLLFMRFGLLPSKVGMRLWKFTTRVFRHCSFIDNTNINLLA